MTYYTKEGYEKLINDYYSLDDSYRETTLAMGISDAMDSDLRENSEYMLLRVKAMYTIPNQKKELSQKIRNAIIIEDTDEYKNWDGLTVIRKCCTSLSVDNYDVDYVILGENEGDIENNILSCEAPFALSILGHKVGDTVIFNGMSIKIKNVQKILDDNIKVIKKNE